MTEYDADPIYCAQCGRALKLGSEIATDTRIEPYDAATGERNPRRYEITLLRCPRANWPILGRFGNHDRWMRRSGATSWQVDSRHIPEYM